MVKILVVISLCILGATLIKGAFNKEEAIKDFMIKADECRKDTGAAPGDIDDLIKKNPAASKEAKCFRACIMKKYGVMDASGKFVKAVALKHSEEMADGDAEKMKIATAIIDACVDIPVPADHCEAAVEYMKCGKEQAKAHGADKYEF